MEDLLLNSIQYNSAHLLLTTVSSEGELLLYTALFRILLQLVLLQLLQAKNKKYSSKAWSLNTYGLCNFLWACTFPCQNLECHNFVSTGFSLQWLPLVSVSLISQFATPADSLLLFAAGDTYCVDYNMTSNAFRCLCVFYFYFFPPNNIVCAEALSTPSTESSWCHFCFCIATAVLCWTQQQVCDLVWTSSFWQGGSLKKNNAKAFLLILTAGLATAFPVLCLLCSCFKYFVLLFLKVKVIFSELSIFISNCSRNWLVQSNLHCQPQHPFLVLATVSLMFVQTQHGSSCLVLFRDFCNLKGLVFCFLLTVGTQVPYCFSSLELQRIIRLRFLFLMAKTALLQQEYQMPSLSVQCSFPA